ncbi:MAG: Bax inhibitor-1/YccA family protein [Moraxella sp.]|nr:Bax inhibitor-1/YccA family protein [Moraxella sp.]
MANPIVSRTELAVGGVPMTVQGTVIKTAFLLGLTALASFGMFFYALLSMMSSNTLYMMAIVSMFAGMGLGLVSAFKPNLAKALAVPYALVEGVFLGGISAIVFRMYPSVPLTALSATFITAVIMLALYVTGVIKVTQKMRSIVTSAIIAIAVVYVLQWVLRLVFGSSIPLLFDGGMIAIGFSAFVIIVAAFSLLLDFDNIDKGVHYGVSQEYEWVYSIGVLATLVWMYIEFLRLLSYLQE